MKKLRKSYHWNQVINNVQIFTDTIKPIFHTFLAHLLFDSNKQHANASFLFRTLLGTEKCLAIKSRVGRIVVFWYSNIRCKNYSNIRTIRIVCIHYI